MKSNNYFDDSIILKHFLTFYFIMFHIGTPVIASGFGTFCPQILLVHSTFVWVERPE